MSQTRVFFVYLGVGEILMRCDTAYGECVRVGRCGLTWSETLLVRLEALLCQDLATVKMCSGTRGDSHATLMLETVD